MPHWDRAREAQLSESVASNDQEQNYFKLLTKTNTFFPKLDVLWAIAAHNKNKAKTYTELNIFFIFPFETWDCFLQAFGRTMLARPCLPVKLGFGNHHQSAWKWIQCDRNELITIIFLLALIHIVLLEFWKAGHELQRKNELTILNSQLLITEQYNCASGMTYSDIQLDLWPYAILDPHA